MTATTAAPARHLRARGNGGTQQTTTVELFFDLVYVFAVTQLSHQILGDLSVAGVARAAFLLLIVWWAWIYTTWMANWFDPASSAVRGVLAGVMLGGPALYLLGESLFGWRTTGATNAGRVAVAALLVLLVPLGGQVSVLLLSLIVAALLPALAVWELR